jgi:Ribbon-helix-helix protein
MSGKDSGFRIRVERDLREKFIEVCRAQDRPAAQVLRDYMRAYIRNHDIANKRPEVRTNEEKP